MRELKTQQQISDWITKRLQAFPCADATVIIQYEIQEPAPDGCNWSEDLVVNYGTSQREIVLQHLRPLHQEARAAASTMSVVRRKRSLDAPR